MSWELPSYSFQHCGQPPTPTRTPTSATFGQTPFQTPKAESSFYDPRVTWNTADPYATSPNLQKTQHHLNPFTPDTKQPSTTSGQKRPLSDQDIDAEISSHVHHRSPNPSLSLPPVEPSRQLSSSPNPLSAKRVCSETSNVSRSPNFGLALDIGSPLPSAGSLQTPPPTGTTSSRRIVQWSQEPGHKHRPNFTSRRMSVPSLESAVIDAEDLNSQINAPPLQLSNLQFSSDSFGLSAAGPATAPAYQQHKLFWDPTHAEGIDIDFSGNLEDPFNTNHQSSLDPFVSSYDQHLLGQNSILSSFLDFSNDPRESFQTLTPLTREQTHSFPINCSVSDGSTRRKPLVNGVDPSLLCSSPSHVADTLTKPATSKRVLDEESLQPYAYQIQEARREKEVGGVVKMKKKRKPTADSPAVKAALDTLREDHAIRPAPQRRNTDSVIIRSKSKARETDVGIEYNPNGIRAPTQRRLSPLKLESSRNDSSASQSRLMRTAVAFTIDASGRARTETKTMIEDDEPTVISQRQYCDSLPDISDSDTSSDESTLATNTGQASSFDFTYPDFGQVRRSKVSDYTKSHSHKSSTSTYISGSYVDTPSRPVDKDTEDGGGPPRIDVPRSMLKYSKQCADANVVSEAEAILGSEGTAQFELRKILERKKREESTMNNNCKPTKNSKAPKQHISPFGESTSPYRSVDAFLPDPLDTHQFISNYSTKTIVEPDSISSQSQRHDNFRCVCRNPKEQGQLITCNSCKMWLHVRCLGSDSHRIPSTYNCPFCTGQQISNVQRDRMRGTCRT